VEVLDRKGHWVAVDKGEKVEVASGVQPRARVSFTNLGEAEWVHKGPGTVYITAASSQNTRAPLSGSLPHMGSVRELDLLLTSNALTEPAEVTISFSSGDQRPFGEKFKMTLVP